MIRDGITDADRAAWWALITATRNYADRPTQKHNDQLRAASRRARTAVVPHPRSDARMRLFAGLVRMWAAGHGATMPALWSATACAEILGGEPPPPADPVALPEPKPPYWVDT